MSNTSLSWADQVARWTIRHAAHRAAPPLSERLEEEWLADLEARPEPWSRLLLGIGCCWASVVIVQEHLGPGLAAATTTGNKVMSSYARMDESLLTRRTATLAIIIGLHVALIFAFASGLGPRMLSALPQTMELSFQDPVKHPSVPPPPPPVEFVRPTNKIPPLEKLDFEAPPEGNGIQDIIVDQKLIGMIQPQRPTPKPVSRVPGGAGKGFPNSEDYYPAASIRLNETGTAVVNVCVDAKGRLTGNPSITRSSGFARLDEGALKLARAGSGHYRAATENGQPLDSCYPLGITFNLRDGR